MASIWARSQANIIKNLDGYWFFSSNSGLETNIPEDPMCWLHITLKLTGWLLAHLRQWTVKCETISQWVGSDRQWVVVPRIILFLYMDICFNSFQMFMAITRQVLRTKKEQKERQAIQNNDTVNLRKGPKQKKKSCC